MNLVTEGLGGSSIVTGGLGGAQSKQYSGSNPITGGSVITDIYQGDPKLYLTKDGANLKYIEGQPVMDKGLENLAFISLLTEEWAGNDLFDDVNQKIGSDFEESTRQPITLQNLIDNQDAALKALKNPAFNNVGVEVLNPNGYRRNITIRLEPPGQDVGTLTLTKNGLNWIAQSADPAHRR